MAEHARKSRNKPTVSHSQRSVSRISIEFSDTVWIEDLQELCVRALQTETQVDEDLRVAASRGQQINRAEEAAGYQVDPLAAFLAADVKSGEKTNEQLIVDAAPKNEATPRVRIASQDALVEANWPVISKALKIDPSGEISQPFIKLAVQELSLIHI